MARTSKTETIAILHCNHCDYDIEFSNHTFCRKCGRRLDKVKKEKYVHRCSNCRKEVDYDWNFCIHCGKELGD